MEAEVTILVNSCDKYEDAWEPFFECLWHFAGELPYPIILNTETKHYDSPHYQIDVVNRKRFRHVSWSGRLLHVLEKVKTDFVFFLLDDYFLKERFDNERLQKVINYLKDNPDVALVDLCNRWAESPEEAEQNRILVIGFNQQNTRYRLMCLLWDIGHDILGA